MNEPLRTISALGAVAILLAGLFWLDASRGGPATMLSRCNLVLTRADAPPADILLIGSSRSGVAFDPVVIEKFLRHETGREITVERLAMGNMSLRASDALMDTYFQRRGAPKIIALETSVMTPRTISRLAPRANGKPSEHYLLNRDQNLMTFAQLLHQPAVAMPYTETEAPFTLWRIRARSLISRAGALAYQFAKAPFEKWSVDQCAPGDFTREPTWPEGFSFSYDDYAVTGVADGVADGSLNEIIPVLRNEIRAGAASRTLQDWQHREPPGRVYPFDFDAAYRRGEMIYFSKMVKRARSADAKVFVIPMALYGYAVDPDDLISLATAMACDVEIIDIYSAFGVDFSTYWYDDAHIAKFPTGVLATALISRSMLSSIDEGVGP